MTNDPQLTTQQLAALEAVLPAYLLSKRWFRAKAYTIASVQIVDAISCLRLTTRDSHHCAGQLRRGRPRQLRTLLRFVAQTTIIAIGDVLSEFARLPDGLAVYDATADPAVALGLLSVHSRQWRTIGRDLRLAHLRLRLALSGRERGAPLPHGR